VQQPQSDPHPKKQQQQHNAEVEETAEVTTPPMDDMDFPAPVVSASSE